MPIAGRYIRPVRPRDDPGQPGDGVRVGDPLGRSSPAGGVDRRRPDSSSGTASSDTQLTRRSHRCHRDSRRPSGNEAMALVQPGWRGRPRPGRPCSRRRELRTAGRAPGSSLRAPRRPTRRPSRSRRRRCRSPHGRLRTPRRTARCPRRRRHTEQRPHESLEREVVVGSHDLEGEGIDQCADAHGANQPEPSPSSGHRSMIEPRNPTSHSGSALIPSPRLSSMRSAEHPDPRGRRSRDRGWKRHGEGRSMRKVYSGIAWFVAGLRGRPGGGDRPRVRRDDALRRRRRRRRQGAHGEPDRWATSRARSGSRSTGSSAGWSSRSPRSLLVLSRGSPRCAGRTWWAAGLFVLIVVQGMVGYSIKDVPYIGRGPRRQRPRGLRRRRRLRTASARLREEDRMAEPATADVRCVRPSRPRATPVVGNPPAGAVVRRWPR